MGPREPTSLTLFLDLCCFLFTPHLVIGPSQPLPLVIAAVSTVVPASKTWFIFTSLPKSYFTNANCFLTSPPFTDASKRYGFFCSKPAFRGITAINA